MVAPRAPHLQSRRRRAGNASAKHRQNDAMCKLCLAITAILAITLLLFGSPGSASDPMMRSSFHKIVERYEIKGYGPTHPRAAFVLVATPDLSDPLESMMASISSILSHTDRNRILVICAVFQDGVLSPAQKEIVQEKLDALDAGTTVHWHGLTKHTHDAASATSTDGEGQGQDKHKHGHKIRVMFSDHKSVSRSRRDAATFIEYLVQNHEQEHLKLPQEHILSVFIRPDSTIDTDHWIDTVTHSVMSNDSSNNSNVPMANAISFASSTTSTYVDGETKSVNLALKPVKSHASSQVRYMTHDNAYPTPVLDGAVTAMALQTYLNLPVADETLDSHFASDLELSWNLWMCADGIDTVSFLHAKTALGTLQHKDKAGMSVSSMVRLAHTWMDGEEEDVGRQVLHLAKKAGYQPDKDGNAKLQVARGTGGGTGAGAGGGGVEEEVNVLDYLPVRASKCRSFDWYMKEVNTAMKKELDQLPPIPRKEDDEYYKEGEVPKEVLEELEEQEKRGKEEMKERFKKHRRGKHQIHKYKKKKPPVEQLEDEGGGGEGKGIGDGDGQEDDESKTAEKQNEKKLPSKPLRPTNKEIISTAQFVDLAYVDVQEGNTDDPHRGAMDENDQFGYVHDEKALHQNPPKFEVTAEQAECDKNDGTKKMLTQKVIVDHAAHEAAEHAAENGGKPRAKIFCLVYTISKNHFRIPAIRQTWGSKCDGFMVGSDKTDRELGTVNIPHEGPEEYNNIWQKVRSMWSYVYDNYYDDYDWFHIGGDDLYVIVENLRLYVESEEIQLAANGGEYLPADGEVVTKQLPLFLGRRFKEQGNEERIFNSGGSGYTMNKAALKALVVEAFPKCMPHLKTFAEDVMVAQCFRNRLKVFPYDTKDDEGGERYMPFQPQHHLNYRMPANIKSDWYATYSIDIKFGFDHCAARSVAFHYIKGGLMERMHAILYGHCDQ